jgi:hypothetical protein
MVMLGFPLVLATLVHTVFPVGVYARGLHESEKKVSVPEEDIRAHFRMLNWRSIAKAQSDSARVDPAELREIDRTAFIPHEDPTESVERLEQETADRERKSDMGTDAAPQGALMRIHADTCIQ